MFGNRKEKQPKRFITSKPEGSLSDGYSKIIVDENTRVQYYIIRAAIAVACQS